MKYIWAWSMVILIQIKTPTFLPSLPLQDIFFGLFFDHFASSILNVISLRMQSVVLYPKMAGKTFAMTLKLQHARYS